MQSIQSHCLQLLVPLKMNKSTLINGISNSGISGSVSSSSRLY